MATGERYSLGQMSSGIKELRRRMHFVLTLDHALATTTSGDGFTPDTLHNLLFAQDLF